MISTDMYIISIKFLVLMKIRELIISLGLLVELDLVLAHLVSVAKIDFT